MTVLIARYVGYRRAIPWASLRGADLGRADLSGASLSGASLRGANLRGANLGRADLSGADLGRADLSGASLSGASLSWADLSEADLRGADLSEADLRGADLGRANLREADLRWANLSGASLSGASLRGANLREANLSEANLSGATGLPDRASMFAESFRFDAIAGGWIAYKQFGLHYPAPVGWRIEQGALLEERGVAPCATSECGSGVSVGTARWVSAHGNCDATTWEVLIPFDTVGDLVVPFAFDGKVRCGRVKLLRTVSQEELAALASQEPAL
jgi:hypothetical protein